MSLRSPIMKERDLLDSPFFFRRPQAHRAVDAGDLKSNYSNCWVVIFFKGGIFRRAWCCLEAAICTSAKCKINVEHLDHFKRSDYFGTTTAAFESDIPLIEQEILNDSSCSSAPRRKSTSRSGTTPTNSKR